MKINLLGVQLLDLDDKPIPGGQANIITSEMLATTREHEDVQKLTSLARKIRRGECDLDNPDLDLIERVVKAGEGSSPFVRGQLIDEIQRQRRDAKD